MLNPTHYSIKIIFRQTRVFEVQKYHISMEKEQIESNARFDRIGLGYD